MQGAKYSLPVHLAFTIVDSSTILCRPTNTELPVLPDRGDAIYDRSIHLRDIRSHNRRHKADFDNFFDVGACCCKHGMAWHEGAADV